MFYNDVEIKTIMIAVHNIESVGMNAREVLLNSIVWLREQYEVTNDISFLKKAVCHIYAYLEMGFPYESGRTEFEKIVKFMDSDIEILFSEKEWRYKRVLLTKANVNRLLGKWNAHFQSMKIDEAVSDIVNKVKAKEKGSSIYHCGKVVEQCEDKILWEKTFVLRITDEEATLQDVNKGKYYMLKEE